MRASRFSDEQIIAMIEKYESGIPTSEICRRHGISSASFYKYRAKFGGMEVSDAKRLKELESENTKLKKLLAEQMLERAIEGATGSSPMASAMLKDVASRKW